MIVAMFCCQSHNRGDTRHAHRPDLRNVVNVHGIPASDRKAHTHESEDRHNQCD